MCWQIDIVQWKKNWKDTDNFWHRKLTLKSKFCNFWQCLLNWTQDLKIFIGLVIGLEPCKMCDCVRQKLGYTKVQLNWLELMLFNPVRTCPRILALNASKRSRSLCYFKRWTEDLGRIRLQTLKKNRRHFHYVPL